MSSLRHIFPRFFISFFIFCLSLTAFLPISTQAEAESEQECYTKQNKDYQLCLLEKANGGQELTEEILTLCSNEAMSALTDCLFSKRQQQAEEEKKEIIDVETKVDIASLNRFRASSIQGAIGDVIKTAMGVMGSLALLMCIYAGFMWMTANGNASQIEKAQSILFWGALGVFVILGSYAIIQFIFEATRTELAL